MAYWGHPLGYMPRGPPDALAAQLDIFCTFVAFILFNDEVEVQNCQVFEGPYKHLV